MSPSFSFNCSSLAMVSPSIGVAPLRDQIVQALVRNGGRLGFDDDSPPEAIRQEFGVSKKAFKQALGRLYKERRIRFQNPGIELLDNTSQALRG
jgi:predicted RNA-binding protein (virulence factor B family)